MPKKTRHWGRALDESNGAKRIRTADPLHAMQEKPVAIPKLRRRKKPAVA
jgi:hypothetical protein